ncbi:CAP domain-containing protein [Nocardioides glacieisoli]|uniref:CAP domain-containing protein n=1 Tax=Nocardioides glacieisoli TaxID=1168730 RepID=A0A4Q2S7T5_9ACTN|nr:CAP domain-containing protein [Nocardioides glacieisoli]RYB96684.1 CAP domain-containing protein [Nocardioides glacieisoli]
MPHPTRTLARLATLVVASAALCAVPSAADAKDWSGPRSTANWSGPRTSAHAVGAGAQLGEELDEETVASDVLEDALMAEINAARAANGLRKIWSFDPCTDQLAEEWGQRIARTGLFEHRDQNDVIRRCDNSWAGETLVRGVGLTPEVMVDLWLDSPGHRDILLSPRARRAGVSVEQDAQGRVIGVVNLVRRY